MQHLYTGCKQLLHRQALVRFLAYHRIKPHAPPLVRAPVNSFEFHPCEHTPQAVHLMRLLRYQYFYCHLVYIVYCADYQGI